ncbi:calcium-translocating P-type ATPase [Immersiella caudata]|uniref:Calcium-transporting ATPase n=1 Tax=Immersiella caudata TaxID=314043 RepID=A0AA40C0U2_9PEZI|nr:calcium-translocating P-type ATPase [Immersiella caudata]
MPHPNDDDSITAVALPSPPAPPPSGNDVDFSVDFNDKSRPENCKFAFSVDHLHKLNDAHTLAALRAFGGLEGLAHGLRTDTKAGLGVDEDVLDGIVTATAAIEAAKTRKPPVTEPSGSPSTGPGGLELVAEIFNSEHHAKGYSDRRSTYGESRLPKPRERSLLQLAWLAFNDKLIFLLTASNIVSLALGIYEAVAPGHEGDSGAKLEWIEGVTIAVAILVIVFGQAINDKVRNKKFVKLNEKNQDRSIAVVKSGKTVVISVFDILVGDLVRLEAGDVVPADGILVDGFTVKCDESPLTGESELVEKVPAREAVAKGDGDCFIHSGTRIEHGVGTYLVTAVGTNSIHGRIRMSLRNDVEETPLQHKLGLLAKQIIIIGFVVGSIFFTILLIRWLVRLRYFVGSPREKGESFLDIFMLSVTVVVIGVPEGLSLAVAVALAFATTRMLKDNNLVRLLRSCETMGNATTICSDKTGTLTQNIMTVVSGIVGAQYSFGDDAESRPIDAISTDVKDVLRQSVTLNSTAFEKGGPGSRDFVGSSTETALLRFGRDHFATAPIAEERENSPPVHLFPFNADRKCMATVIKDGPKYRMLVKGAPEVILPHCSEILSKPEEGLETEGLGEETRRGLSSVARGFSDKMLRPIAIAYRDFESWPPITSDAPVKADASRESDTVVDFKQVMRNLGLAGILALRDPLRPEVIESVRKCQDAGVFVRMVTGDAFETARAISTECGIYTAGGIALDGPTFRKLSSSQLDLVLPRLQVLARSSPEDKARLVRHLKKLGETVAVTGDGTNDAYALKAADVGFAMGISGTEVAKEASSIILMDDNFSSIVKALAWGRTVNSAAKKFIQFQFTINITAAFLTIISALIGDVDSAVFAVIHLLWLNLLMDILAAAALATDYPTDDVLERQPEPRNVHIVSPTMWKMILGQAIYQLIVIFSLHYAGDRYFTTSTGGYQHQAFVFNTYIFMQIFNQWNCRRADNRLNIFAGIFRNPWFMLVQLFTLAGQIVIIFKGGEPFQTEPLTGAQWGWTIFFGSLTLPLGAAIRSIPDSFFLSVTRRLKPVVRPVAGLIRRLRGKASRKASVVEDHRRERTEEYFFGDLEDDEERKIRRFRWRWWTRSSKKTKDGVATAIASAGLDLGGQNVAMRFQRQLSQRRIGTGLSGTGEQEKVNNGEMDLARWIELAKNSPGECPYGLEVHPATGKGDPVIMRDVVGGRIPPSQNKEVRRFLGRG